MRLIVALTAVLSLSLLLNLLYGQFPLRYYECVERYAGDFDLDPLLVMAVIKVESDFDPQAISSVGAVGLMQLMPKTARWLSEDLDPTVPEQNIRLGVMYLGYLLEEFGGDLEKALMAYNVGPNALINGQDGSKYLKKVEFVYRVYRLLYPGF